MRNKTTKVVLLSFASLFLIGGNAFAAFVLPEYANMFMTSDNDIVQAAKQTATQTTFGLDEQPLLYIRFFGAPTNAEDKIGTSLNFVTWTLDGGKSPDKSFFKFNLGSQNDMLIGFKDEYWKDNTKQFPAIGPLRLFPCSIT